MTRARLEIRAAKGAADFEHARRLLIEYAQSLEIDLAFQDFATELDGLAIEYAAPRGSLLLALNGGEPIGCVGLRPWEEDICEMKRLYVRPNTRGTGAGRALAQAVIETARAAGYGRMRLDTLPSMEAARRLYRELGFREIDPYRFNPIAGTAFMELDLSGEPGTAA